MSYFTLKQASFDEFVEKKSRFIGYGAPVSTEQEARAFIDGIRAKHRDATHNVYAYVLRENNVKRFSDDGEPGGTAGVPMLDVLEKAGVTDCAVVGTRYFGGTLLGAGGLVRAYAHTAAIAVAACGIALMTECAVFELSAPYEMYDAVSRLLKDSGAEVLSVEYTDKVLLRYYVRAERVPEVADGIRELSAARIAPVETARRFLPVDT